LDSGRSAAGLHTKQTSSTLRMMYPTWICHDCGELLGNWFASGEYTGPFNLCSTMHTGTCGVCKQEKTVTEPRDYGHLIPDWETKFNSTLQTNDTNHND
jgi:hypothetical protein